MTYGSLVCLTGAGIIVVMGLHSHYSPASILAYVSALVLLLLGIGIEISTRLKDEKIEG